MAQAYYRPDVDSPNAPMGGKVCGKRNPDVVIEARRQRLYNRQLEGLTTRQLVHDHASKENIGVETAWRDWRQVKEWNDEDWEKDREDDLTTPGDENEAFQQGYEEGSASNCCSDIGFVR